jgi:cation diffusion facilitator family transporter
VIGLVVNATLGLVKLIGGIVGSSFALLADAVNSLGDVFISVVVLVALRFAQRPADDEHPYGHSRAEAIAGSNVALLIALSAGFVGFEAFRRLHLVHDLPPTWTLWIAASNVVIKEVLYQYKIRVGRRTGSSAVVANAWDHRSDALCSLAVLIGLGVVRWGGPAYIWADEVAALIVVLIIMRTALRLFLAGASELMDEQGDRNLLASVKSTTQADPEVRRVETLRLRKSGLEYFADLHIELDPTLTVAESHSISHRVKDAILDEFANVRDVLIHVEPHRERNDE